MSALPRRPARQITRARRCGGVAGILDRCCRWIVDGSLRERLVPSTDANRMVATPRGIWPRRLSANPKNDLASVLSTVDQSVSLSGVFERELGGDA
jgi:hypothetical protein